MNRLEHFRGLGATNTQMAQIAIQGSAPIISGALIAAGAVTGPVGMAIAGAIALGSYITQAFAGCGNTCVQATAIVNQIEPYLKQNVQNYLALGKPRPISVQQVALKVFTDAWNNVVGACSNPALGDAGQRCVSDRQRGGKWDWFSYYYDPIANDSYVYDDSATGTVANVVSSGMDTASKFVSGVSASWIGLVALVGLGVVMISSGKGK